MKLLDIDLGFFVNARYKGHYRFEPHFRHRKELWDMSYLIEFSTLIMGTVNVTLFDFYTVTFDCFLDPLIILQPSIIFVHP